MCHILCHKHFVRAGVIFLTWWISHFENKLFTQHMNNNPSYLLLASPVHLIATVEVPEGCKLFSCYKPESSFTTQEDASLYFLCRRISNEWFYFWQLARRGIWLCCFWGKWFSKTRALKLTDISWLLVDTKLLFQKTNLQAFHYGRFSCAIWPTVIFYVSHCDRKKDLRKNETMDVHFFKERMPSIFTHTHTTARLVYFPPGFPI